MERKRVCYGQNLRRIVNPSAARCHTCLAGSDNSFGGPAFRRRFSSVASASVASSRAVRYFRGYCLGRGGGPIASDPRRLSYRCNFKGRSCGRWLPYTRICTHRQGFNRFTRAPVLWAERILRAGCQPARVSHSFLALPVDEGAQQNRTVAIGCGHLAECIRGYRGAAQGKEWMVKEVQSF